MILSKGAILSAIVTLGLVVLGVWQRSVIVDQDARLRTASAAAPSVEFGTPSLEDQRKCAEAAAQAFAQGGISNPRQHPFAAYTNHYSKRLNHCFVDISETTADAHVATSSQAVSDALEGKVLGSYIWINNSRKKYWEIKPSECWVLSITGTRQTCSSEEEFETLSKAYMEG